ncbi:signal peptidase I [Actinobacteria bacterium OK074]|nr:signal peptidase I [Actinobacteria bacterium OK074]
MSRTGRRDEGRGRLGSMLSGLAVALGCVLFLGGFAWAAVEYKPYLVPTGSMTPTIDAGDRVLAQRVDGADVERGDVIVFEDKTWGDMLLVKRVVAVGGDKVACCTAGKLTVNGKEIRESYLPADEAAENKDIPSITVPKGRLFVLGDERSGSLDSTAHLTDAYSGTVARSAVQGRVDAVVWPWKGMLARPTGGKVLGPVSSPGPLVPVTWAVAVGALLILGGGAYGPVAARLAKRRSRGAARREEPVGAR